MSKMLLNAMANYKEMEKASNIDIYYVLKC